MKKLLIFHNTLAPYRIDLFNELHHAFDTHIYFFRKNLRHDKFDMDTLIKQLNFSPKYLTRGIEHPFKDRMLRFGFLRKVALHKPDIILCLEYNIMTFITAAIVKTIRPTIQVYTTCDDSVDIAENCERIRKIGRYMSLRFLDGIVLGNDLAEKWYNKKFPTTRTVVIPIIQKEERLLTIIKNAHQITNQYISKYKLRNKKVLLYVGRLVEVKNLDFLLEVFAQYAATNANAVLILVGDGQKRKSLTLLAKKLNITNQVIFAGRCEYDTLYAWYRTADYLILPSTYEPFGAVVNEALIAGIPVICSNVAGASSLITNANGVTFDPYNKTELLDIMHALLSPTNGAIQKKTLYKSLMPYTFDQRMQQLIGFLQNTNST